MVSISIEIDSVTHDRLLHSGDLAIRELLNEPSDPMAMATYLWVYIQRKPAITNGDGLVHWGIAWIRRIFLEGKVSQRRDEDMSSAALAVAALINTPRFLEIKSEVKRKIEQSIASELDRSLVPFRQSSYGAIYLLAAHMLDVNNPKFKDAVLTINRIYTESISVGRLYGFSFAVKLIKATANKSTINELAGRIQLALNDPAMSYEDQVYLIQGLWELQDNDSSARLIECTEEVMSRVPAWTYQTGQVTGSISIEQELISGPNSHLYRASLMDIMGRYRERIALYEEEKFQAQYGGRRDISLLAFCFLALSLSLLIGMLAFYIHRGGSEAARFWLSGEYGAMTSSSALLYLGSILLASYLLLITPVILWKTFSLLVISNVQSDQKLKDVLTRPVAKISLAWFTLIFLGIVVELVTGVLTQGVQHIFNSK